MNGRASPGTPAPLPPRTLLGLWLLAFLASAAVGTHGILYWDAGDYVTLAIDGGGSGLLLGRPLFLLVSRAVVHAGVDAAWAEPVLRWFWTAVGAGAAPALAVLGARIGLDRPAAWLAGAMVAVSPSFAHTAHQVLTDAPALALSIAALAAAARGGALWTGILLGAAILTRETAAIHLVAAILLLGLRRSAIAILSAAIIMAATLWVFPPSGLADWIMKMGHAGIGPIGWKSLGISLVWILAAGPVAVVVGTIALTRTTNRRMLLVSVPAAIATIALLLYPEGSYSPRYVLASVPVAFFLPAAAWLAARRWVAVAGLAIPLALVPMATSASRVFAARGAMIEDQIQKLPARALVVPAHYCPQARLGAVIHKRSDLGMMCPGWDWPDDPAVALDAALAAGRPVAIDLSGADWWGDRERADFDAVSAWANRHQGQDIAGFLVVGR